VQRCTTTGSMVDSMESGLLLIALACGLSLVLSAASLLWCALFSAPNRQKKMVERANDLAQDALTRVEATASHFIQLKLDNEAFLESVEGVLSSVEKKRRRVAGAESRLNAAEDPEPQTRDEIVSAGRARVYGV